MYILNKVTLKLKLFYRIINMKKHNRCNMKKHNRYNMKKHNVCHMTGEVA